MQLRGVCGEEAQGRSKFRLDSKFSDLNLDLILNLVLLPKNFKMENHENHAPRAIARIKYQDICTSMTNAAARHLPATFMIPIRLYGEIESRWLTMSCTKYHPNFFGCEGCNFSVKTCFR